ncbi:hypothetical protein LXL04_002076 [Taraxacum kok-saghyz]
MTSGKRKRSDHIKYVEAAGDMYAEHPFQNNEMNVPSFPDMQPVDTYLPITRLMIPTQIFPHTRSNYSTEFIKSCFICRKDFGNIVDIFMYKDQSFCSDGCRDRQIENDIEEEMNKREKMKNEKRYRKNPQLKGNKETIFFIDDA